MNTTMTTMTTKALFWFQCKRCNKMFRKYVIGKWINCIDEEHQYCFYDNNIGEIHDNSYLYPHIGLICRNCSKGENLLVYSE